MGQDGEDRKGGGRTVTGDDDGTGAPRSAGHTEAVDPMPEGSEPEVLTRHAQDLTRQDRRSDRRLFWSELVVVLLIAAILVARWQWIL